MTLRLALAATLLGVVAPVRAQVEQLRREISEVGVVEQLGSSLPREVAFWDDSGRDFALGSPRKRPLLVSFNYTGCPRLCSLQLAGLARALRELAYDGAGFEVLTVSIDPAEKRDALRRYKETFVGQAGGGDGLSAGWHFVSGDERAIDALASAVGFRYRFDPRTGEFAHQATLIVITPEGRVSSYLHGISYSAAAVRDAVDRAAASRVATSAEQAGLKGFLLTCMGFNPGEPAPRALLLMRVAGSIAVVIPLALVAAFAVRDLRRRRRA